MKEIIGIGNALVDALYLIENEDIIKEFGLEKGGMHLIGENIFEQVCERMRAAKRERTTGGFGPGTAGGAGRFDWQD